MGFVGLVTQTSQVIDDIASKSVVELVDLHRIRVGISLDPERKARLGQFLTPSPVAKFMASLFQQKDYRNIRLLDAGAGIGSLIAAFTEEFCGRTLKPCSIEITAYELESMLFDELNLTVAECRKSASEVGISFGSEILKEDFVKASGVMLSSSLLEKTAKKSFTLINDNLIFTAEQKATALREELDHAEQAALAGRRVAHRAGHQAVAGGVGVAGMEHADQLGLAGAAGDGEDGAAAVARREQRIDHEVDVRPSFL